MDLLSATKEAGLFFGIAFRMGQITTDAVLDTIFRTPTRRLTE